MARGVLDQTLHIPKRRDLLYTPSHTWARIINDRTVEVGLSAYASERLAKLSGSKFLLFAHSQTEPVGSEVKRTEPFGVVETKTVISFDLVSPFSGRIKKVNRDTLDRPYIINENPEETWIVEIEPTNLGEETPLLLTLDKYRKKCEQCGSLFRWTLIDRGEKGK